MKYHEGGKPAPRIRRRYPLEPLAAAMGLVDTVAPTGSPVTAVNAALTALGVKAGRTRKEYRDLGVSEVVAERFAHRAGFHPYNVWPEMLEEAMAAADDADEAARQRKAAAERERYRHNAESRARRLASAAAYRAANADYVRANDETYRRLNRDDINRRERERFAKMPPEQRAARNARRRELYAQKRAAC